MNASVPLSITILTSRPCNITTDDKLWTVSGIEKDGNTGGVLAWCYGEEDAKEAFNMMKDSGIYENLSYEKFIQ